MTGAKMKWLFVVLLALSLAGCAWGDNFDREKPIKVAVPTEPILPSTTPVLRKSALARAEASKSDANENTNRSSLMECGSQACKIQCAAGLEKGSRPKWCMYFKEPIDRHVSDIQGKSIE
jgi:hypothetical protein